MQRLFAIFLALAVCGCPQIPGPGPIPPPEPGPTPLPVVDLQTAVAPVKSILAGNKKSAPRIGALYSALADAIERDADTIKTTEHIRTAAINADRIYLQKTDLVGVFPGLGSAVNKVLTDSLTLKNRTLDAETRKRAVDAFRALSWAAQEAAK